jgi:putative methionine-R-sulfoxide reductase with GAF domain
MLIQRQAAELDGLKRIIVNLTSSLELQAVLDGVVKEAMQLVKDAQDAHIYLFHEEKLVFGASLKIDGERNIQYAEPRLDGLTGTVAREKKVIIVEDMTYHPLYKDAPKTGSGSIIGIPLKMGSCVIGVMNLARTSRGEFNQSEIRLLTLLADQAAIAIINARLHAAVSHQARSDILTKLPNRRALDERLDKAIAQSIDSGNPFSAVMMDLDGFKMINDTYGHEVGGFLVASQARNDDGILEYATICKVSRLMMFRLMPEVMKGTHGRFKQVRMGTFHKMTLSSDRALYIHADGEIYTGFNTDTRRLSLEVVPGAIQVVRG